MSKLLEYLKNFYDLPSDAANELESSCTIQKIAKGEHIVKIGQVNDKMYFLESGLVRAYYVNKNNEQFTSQLFTENRLFGNFTSYATGTPSKVGIEALQSTVVWYIDKATMDYLCEKYTSLLCLQAKLLGFAYQRCSEHNMMLQSMDAKERYEYFVSKYPELLQLVNLGHIATFLGINQATLSRIRTKIK